MSAPKLQEQSASKEGEIAALEREQAKLLAEVKHQLKTARQAGPVDDNARRKLEELEQLAQAIETRINQKANQQLRNHYFGERSTEPFKSYGSRLLRRLESHGIGRVPQRNGRSVYGSATVLFTIQADGTLEEVEVLKASAEDVGQFAVALLRELQPFEQFSTEMSTKIDRIVFAQELHFVRGDKPQ